MNSAKNIQVNIPSAVQERIDAGDYFLRGNQVRDKKGRIVSNLETLEIDENHYFSQNIFVSIESYAFTSISTVSSRLQEDLKDVKNRTISVENKIDRILNSKTNDLVSAISTFDEHFNSLKERSKLTTEKETFTTGVAAASLLANNIASYIEDYLGEAIVHHDPHDYRGEKYSAFLGRDQRFPPTIVKSEFLDFKNSQAFYFIYSFINLINNLNIIFLCYDSKPFPRYKDNLSSINEQLLKLTSRLIKGLGSEGDIYEMCYATDNRGLYHPLDIERIIKYDDTDIHTLILRNFKKMVDVHFDQNRVSSVVAVITVMEDIENLLKRYEHLSQLQLNDSPELYEIKKLVFNDA